MQWNIGVWHMNFILQWLYYVIHIYKFKFASPFQLFIEFFSAPFCTPYETPRIPTAQHERHSSGKYYASFEVQDCWSFDKEMHDNSRASTVQGPFNVHPCNHVHSQQGQEISVCSPKSRPAVGPTQHFVHMVQRVLWLGYVADSLPLFNARVKNAWSYTSTTPLASQYGV